MSRRRLRAVEARPGRRAGRGAALPWRQPLSPGSGPAGRCGASAHAGARARSSVRWGCGARPPAGGGARRRRPARSALQRGGHRPPPGTRRFPPAPANVRVPGRRARHLRGFAGNFGSAPGRGVRGGPHLQGAGWQVTLEAGSRYNFKVTSLP